MSTYLNGREYQCGTYSSNYGGNPRKSTTSLRHKCIECGVEIKVVYIEDRIDFNRYNSMDRIHKMETKYDHFHCPRCRQQINVIGKVIELTVNMME